MKIVAKTGKKRNSKNVHHSSSQQNPSREVSAFYNELAIFYFVFTITFYMNNRDKRKRNNL